MGIRDAFPRKISEPLITADPEVYQSVQRYAHDGSIRRRAFTAAAVVVIFVALLSCGVGVWIGSLL